MLQDTVCKLAPIEGITENRNLIKTVDMKKCTITIIYLIISFYYVSAQISTADIKNYSQRMNSILQSKYGTSYPSFVVTDLNGDTITEKQLHGKITLINFWFEECAPCIAEIPALNQLYLKYRDIPKFQLLSFIRERPEDAVKCIQRFEISYPLYPIPGNKVYPLCFYLGFPTNIIIDTTGKVVFITTGGPTDPEKARESVRMLEEKMIELL